MLMINPPHCLRNAGRSGEICESNAALLKQWHEDGATVFQTSMRTRSHDIVEFSSSRFWIHWVPIDASVDESDARNDGRPNCGGVVGSGARDKIACALRTRPPERAGTFEEIGAEVSLTRQYDEFQSALRIRSILHRMCLRAHGSVFQTLPSVFPDRDALSSRGKCRVAFFPPCASAVGSNSIREMSGV